jgi:hypothetical protein
MTRETARFGGLPRDTTYLNIKNPQLKKTRQTLAEALAVQK